MLARDGIRNQQALTHVGCKEEQHPPIISSRERHFVVGVHLYGFLSWRYELVFENWSTIAW